MSPRVKTSLFWMDAYRRILSKKESLKKAFMVFTSGSKRIQAEGFLSQGGRAHPCPWNRVRSLDIQCEYLLLCVGKKPVELVQASDQDTFPRFSGNIQLSRSLGRRRTHWRDTVSVIWLGNASGPPQEELEVLLHGSWITLLRLLPLRPATDNSCI